MLQAVHSLVAIALEVLKTYSNPRDHRVRQLMEAAKARFRNATKLVGKDLDMILQHYKAGANAEGGARAFFTQLAARRQGLESRIAGDRDIMTAAKKFMAWDNDHPEPKDKTIINHTRFTRGKREMHNVSRVFFLSVVAFSPRLLMCGSQDAWDRQLGRMRGFERQIYVLDQCIETYQHHLNLTMEFRKQSTQLLASVSEDENQLITLKTAVQKIFVDVVYLEMYTRGPNIMFGRLDLIRCVLKLMRSEEMGVVGRWIGNGIYREKESIITSCTKLLTPTDWDDVQRPYIPIDDDDLGFGYRMVGASTAGFSYVMHDSGLDIDEYRPSPILALARELAAQT